MEKFARLLLTLKSQKISEDNTNINLLALSSEVGAICVDELAKMPLHINVIVIAAVGKLRETAHSSILQNLLRHQSILDSFMASIMGIDNIRIDSKNVRAAEQDHMDVSVYDKNVCLIIENKVNDAKEQQGQIYRYVESALKAGYSEENIRVLYLNSKGHSKPSDFSLTECGEGINRIPKPIEDSMIIKDYAHDIYDWITNLPTIIPETEQYLISALHQYQDYLEEYFHLTDKYEEMKERIRTVIVDSILNGLSDDNDTDYTQRIAALEESSENLQQLINGVNELINSFKIKKDASNIQMELSKSDITLIDLTEFGYKQNNFGVKISINGKGGYIAYGYGDKEYIGFAFDTASLTKTELDHLNSLFKKFGKENYGEEDIWPCWNYIGQTSLLNEFSNFVQYVKAQSENDDKICIP